MEKLKLGFVTTEELACWAGKKLSYIKNKKKAWCESNLGQYAKYELVRGGVKILEIYNPYFYSSGQIEVEQKYYDYYGHDGIKADTCKNCWEKMKPDMTTELKDSTGASYVGQARRKDFGSAVKKFKRDGEKGHSRFIFGKIIKGEFYPFTQEEEEIKAQLYKVYYKDLKAEYVEEQKALTWALKVKEITPEEYAEAMAELVDKDVNWMDFQIALENRLHCKVDFRVLLEPAAWGEVEHANYEF